MVLHIAANVALLVGGFTFSIWFLRSRAVERRQMAEKMFEDRYGMLEDILVAPDDQQRLNAVADSKWSVL
jgi:hypothetical protein